MSAREAEVARENTALSWFSSWFVNTMSGGKYEGGGAGGEAVSWPSGEISVILIYRWAGTCLGIPRDRENLRIKSVLHFSPQTTDCYYWNFGVEFCTTLQLSKQSRNIVGVQLSVFVSFFWLVFVFGLDTLILFLFIKSGLFLWWN